MSSGTWRDVARPIISKVISENKGIEEKELRKLIMAQYPFGVRMYHPYKVWCDEVKIQLGKKKYGKSQIKIDPAQKSLF